MLEFQTAVYTDLPVGIPGDIPFISGAHDDTTQLVNSSLATPNVIGYAYTYNTDGTVRCGGSGAFAGIAINPRSYTNFGASSDPLAPNFAVPDGTALHLRRLGPVNVLFGAAATIGNQVLFNKTTGEISSQGAIASFVASQTTTVLTVASITAGFTGKIGVGVDIKDSTGAIIGKVISLGTGTGGAGTYNLNTSASVGSATFTCQSSAPAGYTQILDAKVDRNITEAGVGGISIQSLRA